MIELKPCPFCGNISILNSGDEGGYWISCFDCPAELGEAYALSQSSAIGICTFGEYETEESAIKAWNTRSGDKSHPLPHALDRREKETEVLTGPNPEPINPSTAGNDKPNN